MDDELQSQSVSLPSFVNTSEVELPQDVEDDPMLGSDAGSEEMELPPDVNDVVGYDDDLDYLQDDDEINDLSVLKSADVRPFSVPLPDVALTFQDQHDIAEFYSPPRVLPVANDKGLNGCWSLDILTGWDFQRSNLRSLSLELLAWFNILFLILSPPCTIFSELQRLWNIKKWSREVFQGKWNEGMVYLAHSMDAAMAQIRAGRYFVFEHPWRASSWQTPPVRAVMSQPGVQVMDFDQCCLGLTSKVSKMPMRKRTKLMTNSGAVVRLFQGCQCDRSHIHQTIQGSEGGVRRSVWAQLYPAQMVDLFVKASQNP